MQGHGTIYARVYTSNAMLPVVGAGVAFTRRRADGTKELLAYRITNYDGCTAPIEIDTPQADGKTLGENGEQPYITVDIEADQTGYDRLSISGAQVFSGTQTVQEMMLLPTPLLPERYNRTQRVTIPPQMI